MIQNNWLRKISVSLCACALGVLGTWLLADRATANQFVRFDFNLFSTTLRYQKSVFIELFDDRPLTRNNFLQYVDGGHYDETLMHRLAYDFVLQGGGYYEDRVGMPAPLNVRLAEDKVDLDGNPNTANPTIMNEFGNTPFRSNLKGTLAMAKTAAGPNSASNQFFFNLDNNSANLDNQNGGFTVFAQVVGNGMNLIDAFATLQSIDLNNDLFTQDNNQLSPTYGDLVSNTPDSTRDFGDYAGPFGSVPFVGNAILRTEAANRTDYFSASSVTNISSSNLTLTNALGHVESGALFSGSGKLIVGTGKTLSLSHGASIGRPVEVSGIFDVGLQIGAVTVNDYKQFAGSTLQIQIAGETVGTQYDQLNVTTTAALAGKLDVDLLSSFKPSAGDTFSLINGSAITGSFSTASLPTLRAGLAWDIQTTATSLKLVVLPDYNNSGTVDQGDLTLWQTHYGSSSNLLADGDGNGQVDGRDFLLWQRFFGHTVTLPPAATILAVPEPSAISLLALATLALAPRRMRL